MPLEIPSREMHDSRENTVGILQLCDIGTSLPNFSVECKIRGTPRPRTLSATHIDEWYEHGYVSLISPTATRQ